MPHRILQGTACSTVLPAAVRGLLHSYWVFSLHAEEFRERKASMSIPGLQPAAGNGECRSLTEATIIRPAGSSDAADTMRTFSSCLYRDCSCSRTVSSAWRNI